MQGPEFNPQYQKKVSRLVVAQSWGREEIKASANGYGTSFGIKS
jgi:hypothetical protein